jgi:hypothetical protein
MLSRVPDHPALVLLSPNPQRSLTAEEEESTQPTRSMADTDSLLSTVATSSSNNAAQLKEGRTPLKQSGKPKDTPALKKANAKHNQRSIHSQSKSGAETQAKAEKRKTRSSDEPDSYEVEEILGHRQDNQARI